MQQPQRKSIRLKGYDYSTAGLYFITLCVHDRECCFGTIENGEMILNAIGKIANIYLNEIPKHYPHVEMGEFIVMPNHVHCILKLNDNDNVGTRHGVSDNNNDAGNNDVRPRHGVALPNNMDNPVGTCHGMSPQQPPPQQPSLPSVNQFGKPVSGSVSVIINQYKSSVKRWCNKNGHEYFKWQSRFHDHIIRNHQSYVNISEYIINNPAKWGDDKFYTPTRGY